MMMMNTVDTVVVVNIVAIKIKSVAVAVVAVVANVGLFGWFYFCLHSFYSPEGKLFCFLYYQSNRKCRMNVANKRKVPAEDEDTMINGLNF